MDGEQDNEDSTTTPKAVIDDGSAREQQQQRQQEDVDKNKDTPEAVIDDGSTQEQEEGNKHSSTTQDNEQDNEDSSSTPEAVIADGSTQEQEEDKEHSSTNQDNKQSSTNQSSWDDDDNESGDDEEYKAVCSDDESEAVRSEEDGNENEEQAANEDEFGAQQVEEGCSWGTKKRRRFTLQEKLTPTYLRVVWRKVDKGISLREASKSINISHKQILNWKKQSEKMKGKSNQHAKSLGDGVQSFLSPCTDRLLSFIFEMRETGMAVSVNSIVLKASQLSREFREKSMTARHSAVRRFINVHGFMHRMGTHLSQCQPSEMEEIAADFIRVTQEKLQMSCRDEAYIINMDQTPVPFSYDPKKTIEVVGRRTIHIRKSTCNTKCATCALTVTASGKMITPLFVFKRNN